MFRAPNNELYLNWQDVLIAERIALPLDALETRREGAMLIVRFDTTAQREEYHKRILDAYWGEDANEPK